MSSIACRVQSGGAGRLHSHFAILIALAIAAFALVAPANAQTANPFGAANAPGARPDLRSLFASWEQADRQAAAVSAATNRAAMAAAPQSGGTVLAIPSIKPVASYRLTSSFGTRSDPFAGSRRMHNGLDMAGPLGTPIYATADGIVGRAQWVGGYGNYIEVNHGGGIQTRYGHLSEILVGTNVRVTRGQLIGRMGSTGRSTGSHLHYEVRIEGRPVNPTPFLTSTDYLAALDSRPGAGGTQIALGASQ